MTFEIRRVTEVSEGDGVDVKRLFPLPAFMNFDPFVLFDYFDIGAGRGFPDHPHRGFEAITYMFEGGMNHKDNLGNESFVSKGGAQRFTAGKGIMHSEMPAQDGKSNGIQLWINLPKKLKQISPSYQQVNAEDFNVKEIPGGTMKSIVGDDSGVVLNTQVIVQHLNLNAGAIYELSVSQSMRGIVYLLQGEVKIAADTLQKGQALFLENEKCISFGALENSEFLVLFGEPHNEAIHQHGPFVD